MKRFLGQFQLSSTSIATFGFWTLFVLLAAARWLHFGPDIDQPHDWRQFDTAQYSRSLAEEGMDPLHPSVAWMGSHKTLILEFPLPELLTAVLYQAFGTEIFWARLVTWLFFCGGCLYLYQLLCRVGCPGLAKLTTLIYMTLPLGFFYSRAVHIDFAAVFFAHAMAYHLVRSVTDARWRLHVALAGALALLGLLVKSPYVFYLLLPCLAYLWQQGRPRRLLVWAIGLSPALLALLLWLWHTRQVNAAAPDWGFIPSYHKFDDMSNWYFGTLELRWMGLLWERILGRIRYEVAGGFPGVYLALAGFLLIGWRRFEVNFMRWWLLGALVYLLIFFPLNFNHNYYQIPFLVPVAFFIALAINALAKELGKLGDAYQLGVMGLAVLLLSLNTWRLTHQMGLSPDEAAHFGNYFQVDRGHIAFGDWVAAKTHKTAPIIVSSTDLDCRAPHLLYLSHRYGWSIRHADLNMPLARRLMDTGACQLAVYQSDLFPAAKADSLSRLFSFVEEKRVEVQGQVIKMALWDLKAP